MLSFSKYHGLGNDFILVDSADLAAPLTADQVRMLCDRHRGIGADGVLIRADSAVADHRMLLTNADGSPAEISGNGLRCFVRYLRERGLISANECTVETGGGVMAATLLSESLVETTMPVPVEMRAAFARGAQPQMLELSSLDLQFAIVPVNVGNPHGVIFGERRDFHFAKIYGPLLEKNAAFPQGANIQFAHLVSKDAVELVTWERGAGITLACGSGSVATACAGAAVGHFPFDTPLAVIQPGGTLTITVGAGYQEIRQRGEAAKIFAGVINL
jgi:diaminopimelate epimerase